MMAKVLREQVARLRDAGALTYVALLKQIAIDAEYDAEVMAPAAGDPV